MSMIPQVTPRPQFRPKKEKTPRFLAIKGLSLNPDVEGPMDGSLRSPVYPAWWKPGEYTEAQCPNHEVVNSFEQRPTDWHPAPQENCNCGIYATRRLDDARAYGTIYAVLDMRGKIVMGTDGVRAEKGKIWAIIDPDTFYSYSDGLAHFAKTCAEKYGVPMISREVAESLAAQSWKDQGYVPPVPTDVWRHDESWARTEAALQAQRDAWENRPFNASDLGWKFWASLGVIILVVLASLAQMLGF